MIKNNILLLVENLELVAKLNGSKNITFLFPIEEFTVGYQKTFKVEELPENSYIFINRILDNEGILKLKELLKNVPKTIKGIMFDDIGVLQLLIENHIELESILFLNHMNCNYKSINAYLEYVNSAVVSPDITIEEIDEILENVNKPVVLYTFGYMNIMYSRRNLLSNYNRYFNESLPSTVMLEETSSKKQLKMVENKYGTVVYTNSPFNGLELLNRKKNVLYHFINTVFLSNEEVINILTNPTKVKYDYTYLSKERTIFKLKEGE